MRYRLECPTNRYVFKSRLNCSESTAGSLRQSGSEFQTVGPATEKARVPKVPHLSTVSLLCHREDVKLVWTCEWVSKKIHIYTAHKSDAQLKQIQLQQQCQLWVAINKFRKLDRPTYLVSGLWLEFVQKTKTSDTFIFSLLVYIAH